jgi:hypothetical protein
MSFDVQKTTFIEIGASTCKDFSLQQGNIGPCNEFARKWVSQGNGKEKY